MIAARPRARGRPRRSESVPEGGGGTFATCLWCVIQAWYEMGIDPADFGMPKLEDAGVAVTAEPPTVLRVVWPG